MFQPNLKIIVLISIFLGRTSFIVIVWSIISKFAIWLYLTSLFSNTYTKGLIIAHPNLTVNRGSIFDLLASFLIIDWIGTQYKTPSGAQHTIKASVISIVSIILRFSSKMDGTVSCLLSFYKEKLGLLYCEILLYNYVKFDPFIRYSIL